MLSHAKDRGCLAHPAYAIEGTAQLTHHRGVARKPILHDILRSQTHADGARAGNISACPLLDEAVLSLDRSLND
eukprot:7750823-Alexandrium_andersonii.AAC.1